MLNEERAARYIYLFNLYGDRWRGNVPVDATVKGDSVWVSGIQLDRQADGTWLAVGDQADRVNAYRFEVVPKTAAATSTTTED